MKLGFAKAATIAAIPVWVALGIGAWVGARSSGASPAELEQARQEEVTAQARLLIDSVWSAIETIQSKAEAIQQVRRAGTPAAPSGLILDWAELGLQGDRFASVRQSARNPAWQPGPAWDRAEGAYLQDALRKLSMAELRTNGAAILRVKQDPDRPNEWLALAFPGVDASSAVLALVDPADAFPMFRRWGKRSEGGNLRAYLAGTDGYVLVHSQKSYVASDFSVAPVFGDAVRPLLTSDRISGVTETSSIDRLPVTAAYARPGTLPLAVVVERVAIRSGAPAWARIPYETALAALGGLAALTLLAAFLLRRGALAIAAGRGGSAAEPAFEAMVKDELEEGPASSAEIDLAIQEIPGGVTPEEGALGAISVPGSGVSVPLVAGRTSADAVAEALIAASQQRQPAPNPEPARPASSAAPDSRQERPAPAPAPLQQRNAQPPQAPAADLGQAARSALTQMILDAELRSAVARNRAGATAGGATAVGAATAAGATAAGATAAGATAAGLPIPVPSQTPAAASGRSAGRGASFHDAETAFSAEMPAGADPKFREDQAERLLIAQFENEALKLRDPKKIAYQLAELMSKFSGCPALYFGYHPGLRAAILGAHSGFGPGQAPQAMSFPINDPILARIMRSEREGRAASLSDYAPLTLLLTTRLKMPRCEAWAVTGSGNPPLLGVLALVGAPVGAKDMQGAALARVMKTTGLIYENALLTTPQ